VSKGRERSVRKMIANAGLTCSSVSITGSGHLMATVEIDQTAAKKSFYFASTPSDHRSDLNKMSMIKGWMRATLMSLSS
jgi:hypothetical protein